MDKTKLTKAQLDAITELEKRWHKISEPTPEFFGNGAVMVECFYSTGHSMWVGIEPDGYRHS